MTALDLARDYLARGWMPIPVPYGRKRPVLTGWEKLRLAEADLRQHFNGRPQNVGILMGDPSRNLVDIDLDAGQALIAADHFLPHTNARFGRASKPRSHRLYYCSTYPVVASAKYVDPLAKSADVELVDAERGTLIELRSTGLQTVFPGSTHEGGESIRWDEDGSPTWIEGEILSRLVKLVAAATLLARYWPNGARHDAALALAGGLLRVGWAVDPTERFIKAVADAAGDPESRDRVRAVVDSAKKQEAGTPTTGWPTLSKLIDPRAIEKVRDWLDIRETGEARSDATWESPVPFRAIDVPDFPVDALPSWLGAYVAGIATETQTPADLAGMIVLAVLGIAAQRKVVIRLREGWIEPTNLYVVCSLPSGSRKSRVLSDAATPVYQFERDETRRLAETVTQADTTRKIAEQRSEALRTKAAKLQANDPTSDEARQTTEEAQAAALELVRLLVPTLPRMLVDDVTPEKLANLLASHGGRMAALIAEGDLFDLMSARYGNAPNFGVFLRAHCGDNLRIDRVNRPPEFVESPTLTLGIACQPDVLRGLVETKGLRGRGLLARFLYSWSESLLGRRAIGAPTVPGSVRDAYQAQVLGLLRMGYAEELPGEEPKPHVLHLAADAQRAFVDFERWLEPRLAETSELGPIADWGGKLAGHVGRVAALLHLADHASDPEPWRAPVGAETVERAIVLGRYLIGHARRTFAEMGSDEHVADAKYLLGWIERDGITSFSKRDAHRATQGRFEQASDLDRPLEILTEHGYVREHAASNHPGPGRKASPTYDVNPLARADSVNSVNSVRRDQPSTDEGDNQSETNEAGSMPDTIDAIDRIPSVETQPAIGERVYCLGGDGVIQTPEPLTIAAIETRPDGELYARFAETSHGWPLARCATVAQVQADPGACLTVEL